MCDYSVVMYISPCPNILHVLNLVNLAITGMASVHTVAVKYDSFTYAHVQVAAGERLPVTQEEIICGGHAFEARVYAENPDE